MKIKYYTEKDFARMPSHMVKRIKAKATGIVACLYPHVKTGHLFTCSRKERRSAYQNPRQFFFASLNQDVAMYGMHLMGFDINQYYLGEAILEHVTIRSDDKDIKVLLKRAKK